MDKENAVKAEIDCPYCGGQGWYEGTGTHWAMGPDGDAVPEPEPIQIQCECCGGSGTIETNAAIEKQKESGK